jgi:hypothetical protein
VFRPTARRLRIAKMSFLDTDVQIFVITLVLIFGFFLGHAMDGVLGDEGFGAYGNMFWIITGFAGGIFAMHYYGMSLKDMRFTVGGGLSGSFALLASLVLGKYVLHRKGY